MRNCVYYCVSGGQEKGRSRRASRNEGAESVVQKKGRGNLTTTCSIELIQRAVVVG